MGSGGSKKKVSTTISFVSINNHNTNPPTQTDKISLQINSATTGASFKGKLTSEYGRFDPSMAPSDQTGAPDPNLYAPKQPAYVCFPTQWGTAATASADAAQMTQMPKGLPQILHIQNPQETCIGSRRDFAFVQYVAQCC